MNSSEIRIRELRALDMEQIFTVHYACENFFTVKDRPVAISCISFVKVSSLGDITYSVTDKGSGIAENGSEGERYVLGEHFAFLQAHPDHRFVHWNMNSSAYGFRAIETRYRYIDKAQTNLFRLPEDHAYDLDDLIAGRYGKDYADHPKLYNLGKANGFADRYILRGKDEADKLAQNDHGSIRRSTSEKAKLIAFLLKRLLEGTLETKGAGPFVHFAGSTVDSVHIVLSIAAQFNDVARQLQRRYSQRSTLTIQDEYDVQDLYHALLRIFFADVRKEQWVPDYAGSSARIDFLLPEYGLAIELKHSRPSMTKKELGDQLLVDVGHYRLLPSVRHLVCITFDKNGEHIENPRGIERDLTRIHDNLPVTVKIIDR